MQNQVNSGNQIGRKEKSFVTSYLSAICFAKNVWNVILYRPSPLDQLPWIHQTCTIL